MKNFLIAFSVFFSVLTSIYSSEYNKVNLTNNNRDFLQMMIPQVKNVNYGISLQRRALIGYRSYFIKTSVLTNEDINSINKIAVNYKYDEFVSDDFKTKNEVVEYFDGLLERVDVIPEKMIIAQGILESGWGRSKAAKECNNYFGLTCRGCGGYVVTSNPNAIYYLKNYETLGACISDYAYVLNTNRAYLPFRKIRENMRANNTQLNSQKLILGLLKYSEMGYKYINKVNFIIHKYLNNDLIYYMHLG